MGRSVASQRRRVCWLNSPWTLPMHILGCGMVDPVVMADSVDTCTSYKGM
jgi:hypothetical protein